jgi:hypothetical protein
MKRAISFMLLIAYAKVVFCQNLVQNPGFETWNKITRPSGWSHVENCLKDSASVISGNYSCMQSGGATTTSDLGQLIPVISGKEYRLSLYNKTFVTSTGKGSRIWCYWKDSESNSLYDIPTDAIMRPSQYLKSETWQEFSISIVAPPEAVAFYLEVRTNTNSIAFWDDFVFEEQIVTTKPETPASQIIIYPNPATYYLNISNITNLHHIYIQSITGTLLWQSDFGGEQAVTIPVAGIPKGYYILRMVTSNQVITRKFIKE